jgi:myo-inositol-1(or 4)-monophosphatase
MPYISPTLTLMVGAVKKVTAALTRDFNEIEHLQTSVHYDGSFAVRSHEKAVRILGEELSKIKGGYPVVMSAKDAVPASGSYFAVSPLNGFANFAHGNAQFAVSVALVENNVVTDAVVYSPVSDELFFAEKGCGAFKEGFRNHERLRVAATKSADKAIILCNATHKALDSALSLSANVRVSGAVALDLAHLAAGKADAVIADDCEHSALSAGILLVKESGGYVFAIGQQDVRSENLSKAMLGGSIFATNEALRQKIADATAK